MLQSLLPGGNLGSSSGGSSSTSNASGHGKASDVSKAAMLHRGAEYIRVLRTEKQQQQEEMEQLKQTIESLNTAIRYYITWLYKLSPYRDKTLYNHNGMFILIYLLTVDAKPFYPLTELPFHDSGIIG